MERFANWAEHDENGIKGFRNEYSWLSNFYPCHIEYKGYVFMCVEAAYCAAKCANASDVIKFVKLNANESVKLMTTLKTRAGWNTIKLYIMSELIFYKFLYNKELRDLLIETDNKYIEEKNMWKDTYWGVCDGIGENKLGKIIMATREYFKNIYKKNEYENRYM